MARLVESDKELKQLQKQHSASATIHLRVIAGQIASTAMGSPLEPTQSQRASSFRAQPAVIALAELAGRDPATFVEQINKLLDRRNNTAAHQSSVTMLDEQVATCQELLTPELRVSLKWEAWFVDNYTSIKAKLPDQFR